MKNSGKVGIALGGLAIVGVAIFLLSSGASISQFTDGGVDVRNTRCQDLASARVAISNELEERKLKAKDNLSAERGTIGDAYWAQNQKLEAEYHQCISRALTADPCKEPFEEVGRLYEEIMADFEAGKGFNEAKFNEREAAKKRYNDCVEQTRKPEFYENKKVDCDAALAAGRDANQKDRQEKEAVAQSRYDVAVASAQSAFTQKQAILDAIEKECKKPGGTSSVDIGAINTGGTGTAIQPNSSSCTGIFDGNNPDLRRELSDLENQLQKAKASGLREGPYGIPHLQSAIDEVRQKLKDSERTCKVDADCGNPEPVCCSGTQVGRAYCDAGVCSSELRDCVSPEICAGKPAACVAPGTGVQQQDGVSISRTISAVGPCSENLQTLNLKQASPDSVRFSIVGNIPAWLHFDKTSGALPGTVNVTYSCNTVQGFGPGVYTANGSITVFNAASELINTIPLMVSITVTASEKMIDVIDYQGKLIPVSQVHTFTGPSSECDGDEHWHANEGSVKALDGTVISDPGGCGYGKTKNVPIRSVPEPKKAPSVSTPGVGFEVRGLEGLRGN